MWTLLAVIQFRALDALLRFRMPVHNLIWLAGWRREQSDDVVDKCTSTEANDPGHLETSSPADIDLNGTSCCDEAREGRPDSQRPCEEGPPVQTIVEPVDAALVADK